MKFISEHLSVDELKSARVFLSGNSETPYMVIVKDDTGTHYQATFNSIERAEDYAEDWVLL